MIAWWIWIVIGIIITEVYFIIQRRKSTRKDWVGDKFLSIAFSLWTTGFIFIILEIVSVYIREAIISLLVILGIALFFFLNYLLEKLILKKIRRKGRKRKNG